MLQTVYLKVLDGKARFEGTAAFKTWLFSVIRRTAAERRRWIFFRTMKFTVYDEEKSYDLDKEEVGDRLDATELQLELTNALRKLPRRQRELLHLTFYQDFTIEDSARILGISVGTARTHYERGKERLRQLLATSHVIREMMNGRLLIEETLSAAKAGR